MRMYNKKILNYPLILTFYSVKLVTKATEWKLTKKQFTLH